MIAGFGIGFDIIITQFGIIIHHGIPRISNYCQAANRHCSVKPGDDWLYRNQIMELNIEMLDSKLDSCRDLS